MSINRILIFVKGFNLGLLAFAVLFIGGSAYFMSSRQSVDTTTKADEVESTITGFLVKKGTTEFKPCKGLVTDYAILDVRSYCTPIIADGSSVKTLVNLEVLASGMYQNGLFYVSSFTEIEQ